MDNRIGVLYKLAHSNYPISFFRVTGIHREELKAYKIKLEILFSETDRKEQSKTRPKCQLQLKFYGAKFLFCIFLFLTDFKAEKKFILCVLIDAEKLITFGTSDDFDRYTKMGLQSAICRLIQMILVLQQGIGTLKRPTRIIRMWQSSLTPIS